MAPAQRHDPEAQRSEDSTSAVRTTLTQQVEVDALAQVYRAVHVNDLHLTDHSEPSVEQRLEWTVQAPGFAAAVAYAGERIAGTVLGCPLPPETQWWRDLRPASEPNLVREWPGRTFAVCEAFVLPEFRGHQAGIRLLSTLLESRTEQRVSLAVAHTNTRVLRSMRVLGWQHVGDLVPFPGWRRHGMFIRPLPWQGPPPPAG